jgi:purine-nucleoside phosphorylase
MKTAPNALIGRLDEAKALLLKRLGTFPKILIVLGSGLSSLADDIEREAEIALSEIPHVKPLTVQGHVARLVVGKLHGVRVACLQGRLHYYEGHSMEDVVFPVRAFARAGAELFFLTNAAGGLRPEMSPLDFLLIRDHLNLFGTNPLIGPNHEELGVRFPDMTHVYDPEMRKILVEAAGKHQIPIWEGVYVGIHGPSYETPAEIRLYRQMGGDVVGMSTVPEAIALRHMGKRVVGLSCITNMAAGVTEEPLVHDDVLANGKKIYGRFSKLMGEAIRKMEAAL